MLFSAFDHTTRTCTMLLFCYFGANFVHSNIDSYLNDILDYCMLQKNKSLVSGSDPVCPNSRLHVHLQYFKGR